MPTTTSYAFANNVSTTIASAISSSVTTIPLASSANFPTIPAGFVWAVTINDRATQTIFEIVYVTSTSGANLTCLRGQEGTTARAWSVGDYAFAANTAGALNSFVDQTSLISYVGLFNPRTYGALGNGTTNDAAAFTNANTASAGATIYVTPGNYLISSSITITSPVVFASGAILTTSGAATVTFSYTPQAGRYPIFGGTALTSAAVLFAVVAVALDPLYPEWWGAVANNSSVDNSPAFQQAGNALAPISNTTSGNSIFLGAGNYEIKTPVSFLGLSNFAFAGQGSGVTTITSNNANLYFGGVNSGTPQHTVTVRGFSSICTSTAGTTDSIFFQYGSDAKVIDVVASATSAAAQVIAVSANTWTGGLLDGVWTRGAIASPLLLQSSPDWTMVNGDYRCDTTYSTGGSVVIAVSSPNFIANNNRIYATGAAKWLNVFSVDGDFYHLSNNCIVAGCYTGAPYVVTTSQLNGYIDYQSGTWTPTDQSGATIPITLTTASWVKIGKLVSYQFDITYGTNSNASQARINAPFPSSGFNAPGATVAPTITSGGSTTITAVVTAGLFIFSPQTGGTAQFANLNLSGMRLTAAGSYQATY